MDRFENMNAFVRVVEAGSISAAADRMDVAKSVVSRRLKELEEHLGVELFHRTTRQMNLTDSGRAFYQQSVRILADILEAEHATSQFHGALKGNLKVAVPLSFGLMHLGPAITAFLQTHPDIEFDLDFNDRQVDLLAEGFDLAIRIASLPDSSLIARRLAPIQAVMCASPAYLERMGTPQAPEELIQHRCLVYNLISNFESWNLYDAAGQLIKTKITPYLKASNGEFLRDAAADGLGIVLLPAFIVYREIERGALVPVLTGYHYSQLAAYAIYPQTRHLSQRVRAFVDFLSQRFEGMPYWDSCLHNANNKSWVFSSEFKLPLDHPDSLPEADEECCSGEHADGPGQSIPAAQAIANGLKGKSAQNTPVAGDEAETGGIRRQNATGK